MTTPRLGAPELTEGQAVPETTVNEQIRYIEAGAGHFIFKDRDLATPPGSPADGDCYLVAASPTGTWTGHAGDIAFYMNTAWIFIEVIEGFTAWVNDENVFIGYNGSAWALLGGTPTECIIIAVGDESTAATTGTAKVTFRMPYAFTLTSVKASVTTAPTGSTLVVDINEAGASILSTKLSIDASEKTSATAATPAVISDASLAADAEMTIDIDQVGSTVAGTGLKVTLIGHQ
jgi:hypothetical protein